MKYLCENLRKYVEDLYEDNYKPQMKESRGVNRSREDPCSLTGR